MDFKLKLIFELAPDSAMGDINRLADQIGVGRIQWRIRQDRQQVYSDWGCMGRYRVGQWVRVLAALSHREI